MKNRKIQALLVFVALLTIPVSVYAFSVQNGNSVYVAKDQTVEGNLYAAGESIIVDGHVTGDIFCAGQSININGVVDGDVICVGQTISVNGSVGGSVRTAGNNIEIRGKVDRGLTAAGANINLAKDSSIGWDALVAAASMNTSGTIGRSLMGAGANFVLGGSVGNDVSLYLDSNTSKNNPELTALDSAVVGGSISYTSKNVASISPKAQIKGKVSHNTLQIRGQEKPGFLGLFGEFLLSLASALVVAYILIAIWKKPVTDIVGEKTVRFWTKIGWGAIWMILMPIVAILIAITVIGFRLVFTGFLLWLVVLMLSKIVAGIAVGDWIVNKIWIDKKDSIGWIVAIGMAASWAVFYVPFIGWMFSLVAIWWGTGAILMQLKSRYDVDKADVK